jgi:competence protein ComGC
MKLKDNRGYGIVELLLLILIIAIGILFAIH